MAINKSTPKGRNVTQLRPKIDGELGNAINDNKGVFRGIPMSAKLFAIYFGAVIRDDDNAYPDEIRQTQSATYEGNEFEERTITTHLWRK